jgi:pilus assembly protein CpaB
MVLGIICMVLAVTLMFGVAPIVNRVSSQKVKIVRAVQDIAQGQQITAKDVKMVEVGGYNLPTKVMRSIDLVVGTYASCEIKTDDYLLPDKLTDTADSADNVFRKLKGEQQAISITIPNFASGLSGKLQNGDIVSIIVTNEGKTTIPAELTYVQVITTTTSGGNDRNELTENKDGSYEMPSTVTLLVNPTQAKLLARYEALGKMHITLVYRGDEERAKQFLEVQKKVFKTDEVKADE